MTLTERARGEGIPASTAWEAARRVGIEAGNDLSDHEWTTIKAAITGGTTKPRPVIQMDASGFDMIRFPSITRAAEVCGTYPQSILNVCRGRQRTAGGYLWRYAE